MRSVDVNSYSALGGNPQTRIRIKMSIYMNSSRRRNPITIALITTSGVISDARKYYNSPVPMRKTALNTRDIRSKLQRRGRYIPNTSFYCV